MIKNFKLVKENSGKLAATSTIALMGLGFTGHADVQADEVTTTVTPKQSVATTSALVNTTPTTVAEATAVVASAQNDADSTSVTVADIETQVDSQSAAVSEASSEISTLEADLISAVAEHSEAVEIRSQATPERLSEVASELASTTEIYGSQSALNSADQSAVDSQSAVVSSASASASEATASASEAAAKVNELTSLVEAPERISTDLATAKSEVARLEKEVKAAELAVSSATTLATSSLNKQLEAKVSELSSKTNELTKLKAAQATGTTRKNVIGTNAIVLPSTYKTQVMPALTAIEKSGWTFSQGYNTAVARYTNQIEAGLQSSAYGVSYNGVGVNSYKSIAEDARRSINVNNLSPAVQNEMAQFTADLLNSVRAQLGLSAVVVTKTAQDMATAIANEYRRTGFGRMGNPHSSRIIGAEAAAVGLTSSDNRGYESLGFFGNATTVDQLKNYFYNTIVYMLFNDATSRYGHTISLLQNSNKGPYYLGVSATSNAQHIYMIPSSNITSAAKFSTAAISGSTPTVNNSAQIAAVNAAIAKINSEIATLKAQGANIANVTTVANAKATLVSLKAELTDAKADMTSLTRLATKLAANKSQLAKNLETAKQVNTQRLQAQLLAQNNLTAELKTYQALQAKATASATKVSELNANIVALQELLVKLNDPELVEKAAAKVAELELALATAKEKHANEVAALALLATDLQDALAAYRVAQTNLTEAKLVLKSLSVESSKPSTSSVVADTMPMVSSTKDAIQTTSFQKPTATQSVKDPLASHATENVLPETGDDSAVLTMVAGATMVSLASMVLSKKRYK